ncbi:helix-turn-helix transcriptional regulator [Limosilactobacillus sp. pH52_RY]|uniref:helix-turn-helix domain-containing protein n=1 Tax=Limosilactobacillus balticus TaxID=2759747 RepID=UPI0015FC3FB8|nr:helix-turn-helix transcriptional regulator [Limosilactobacillus balticus]MBB1109441.1 helix-turn-helix transcriptional regulator [Limosilactobacillus balticus]
MLFERIKQLAKNRGVSLKKVATDLGFGENTIYKWKTQSPKGEYLEKVADYFDVTTDYLLGRTDTPQFTRKDERDVQKILNEMIEGLSDQNALSYMKNGDEEISPEDAELLRASLENAVRTSKILAKKKFTPKKYRKNND